MAQANLNNGSKKVSSIVFESNDKHIQTVLNDNNIEYLIELAACTPIPDHNGLKHYETGDRLSKLGRSSTRACKELIFKELGIEIGNIHVNNLVKSIQNAPNKEDGISQFLGVPNFKPTQSYESLVTSDQSTQPIFTKDDFTIASFNAYQHQDDDPNDADFHFEIIIPEIVFNLITHSHVDLNEDNKDREVFLAQTKASNVVSSRENDIIEIQYKGDDGLRNFAETDILQGFTDAANAAVPRGQERARQQIQAEAQEKAAGYGIQSLELKRVR